MCSPLKKWFQSAHFYVYLSHFLSSWGDRMWAFGVGLFLANIESHNLQLPAIYGLSGSLTIFFVGAVIGDWVDNTPRLKAAVLSLGLQNMFVVICAAGVYAFLWFETEIRYGERSLWLLPLCQGGIILLAILSLLASLARQIAVEKDWIVEICGKDKDKLATMTASLRRIDQGTLILAPIATGQVMTFASLKNGALFIAAWNIVSWFLEYILLRKVYDTVPALRNKKGLCRAVTQQDDLKQADVDEEEQINVEKDEKDDDKDTLALEFSDARKEKPCRVGDEDVAQSPLQDDDGVVSMVTGDHDDGASKTVGPGNAADKDTKETGSEKTAGSSSTPKRNGKCERFLSRLLVLYRGWRTYTGYSVALAGLALACLYMTVLGFDNITVAYATTQGVSESILGILMGASAVFGILGTFGYPALRRRVGLERTGIFALSCQVTCLVPCVVSIWMPGSPFDPLYYFRSSTPARLACTNVTAANTTIGHLNTSSNVITETPAGSLPSTLNYSSNNTSSLGCDSPVNTGPESYLSVGLLIAGIVLARFGLWIADLTITQLFLEAVVEKERGIVGGVQSSLNKIMDVLKFVLVVAFPDVATFGYLIIISFCFICLGWLFYAIFLRKARGHFFHLDRLTCSNGHTVTVTADGESPAANVSEKEENV